MNKMAALILLMLITAVSALPQINVPLHCGSKIYISPMENELDGYIRAKFVELHVPLVIVMDKQVADLIMTGGSKQFADHWYDGGVKDKNTGTIAITDKAGNFVWGGAAGDRNIWWGNLAKHGPEKVATRIVDKLKKAIAQPCTE
jgi:hypothetical protein